MKWFKSLVTDDEWDTDIVLVAVLGSVVFIICMSVYVVVFKNGGFDPISFGTGVATTLGGGGGGYFFKRLGDKRKNLGGTSDDSLTNLFSQD